MSMRSAAPAPLSARSGGGLTSGRSTTFQRVGGDVLQRPMSKSKTLSLAASSAPPKETPTGGGRKPVPAASRQLGNPAPQVEEPKGEEGCEDGEAEVKQREEKAREEEREHEKERERAKAKERSLLAFALGDPSLSGIFPSTPGYHSLDDLNLHCLGLSSPSHSDLLAVRETTVMTLVKGDNIHAVTPLVFKGEPAPPPSHPKVRLHYIAWWSTKTVHGRMFDNSYTRGKAFGFRVGTDAVFPGLDNAVKEMSEGQKVLAFVPPGDGFGARSLPGLVPPNAYLVLYIVLLSITHDDASVGTGKRSHMQRRCAHCTLRRKALERDRLALESHQLLERKLRQLHDQAEAAAAQSGSGAGPSGAGGGPSS